MGEGKKKKASERKENGLSSWTVNCSVTARNLGKRDIGGVIFGCKHDTINECFSKKLFGQFLISHFHAKIEFRS